MDFIWWAPLWGNGQQTFSGRGQIISILSFAARRVYVATIQLDSMEKEGRAVFQ